MFIQTQYHNTYHYRHRKLDEASFFNSIEVNNCPFCKKNNFKKKGFSQNNAQRYYCNYCHKSFNVLTNTIFDNHKTSISKWIEFLLYLFGYESIQEISKSNKNSSTTTKFWLKKLFLELEHYQDSIVLLGVIYIDEMF